MRRDDQNEIFENRRNYRTSRISIPSRPETVLVHDVGRSRQTLRKNIKKGVFHAAETASRKSDACGQMPFRTLGRFRNIK